MRNPPPMYILTVRLRNRITLTSHYTSFNRACRYAKDAREAAPDALSIGIELINNKTIDSPIFHSRAVEALSQR